ncbi:hypothetical protein IF655_29230 [Streptomyces sp. DSM 110735]|uniref:hypothetical protein n=1 Tax=Streptomyces sp. DSM 110735 TaxID=2775031 RepID=UPI0018F2F3D1|nr:hypothetical protein [Streptomyces sp. DSM 110735]MBJ7907375.1 hypothetical protein [Streptomyces sp. DSM 110735]
MPQHAPTPRVCRDCDGHASAMVTTGARTLDGSRVLVRVDCPACQGTGHHAPAAGLVRAGR